MNVAAVAVYESLDPAQLATIEALGDAPTADGDA